MKNIVIYRYLNCSDQRLAAVIKISGKFRVIDSSKYARIKNIINPMSVKYRENTNGIEEKYKITDKELAALMLLL